MSNNTAVNALLSGLAGASALTLIHESVRHLRDDAPRMDTLGRRSIAAGLESLGFASPPEDRLQAIALGSEIVCNTAFYSLAATGRPSYARGAALGSVAGLAAVALPPVLGLGHRSAARTRKTAVMTFCWYLAGGLVASTVHHALHNPDEENIENETAATREPEHAYQR